ncbi:hypothetical protein IWW55_007496 [Coemansia sp. RSA 2706]|nr:hypothetical protein IWW55_007496 [Coemansia sp. RSA 2706]KAJ2307611.1 hypothetical protein IWW52_006025 [Coemansia sp. RSA 2704]
MPSQKSTKPTHVTQTGIKALKPTANPRQPSPTQSSPAQASLEQRSAANSSQVFCAICGIKVDNRWQLWEHINDCDYLKT